MPLKVQTNHITRVSNKLPYYALKSRTSFTAALHADGRIVTGVVGWDASVVLLLV
jgi:hypothetical protein